MNIMRNKTKLLDKTTTNNYKCEHKDINTYQFIDYANDRIYNIRICKLCNKEITK